LGEFSFLSSLYILVISPLSDGKYIFNKITHDRMEVSINFSNLV
jgi:hypothetical protein